MQDLTSFPSISSQAACLQLDSKGSQWARTSGDMILVDLPVVTKNRVEQSVYLGGQVEGTYLRNWRSNRLGSFLEVIQLEDWGALTGTQVSLSKDFSPFLYIVTATIILQTRCMIIFVMCFLIIMFLSRNWYSVLICLCGFIHLMNKISTRK